MEELDLSGLTCVELGLYVEERWFLGVTSSLHILGFSTMNKTHSQGLFKEAFGEKTRCFYVTIHPRLNFVDHFKKQQQR